MSKTIRIGKEQIGVSDKIYKEYYRMDRRQRYLEKDIKAGRIDVDSAAEAIEFIPSKEDSINRLMDQGADFEGDQMIEDILCDKATLLILQEAMSELNQKEQELIQSLYYKDLTVREVAELEKVSHVAVIKRRNKVLDKLKKYFL